MPERRAGPASSPAVPATSLTLELVEAVHGLALAASPGAAWAAPQAKIAARGRSERSRRCCEEKDCMSTSGFERFGGEFSGRRPAMRRQHKQNASRFCERQCGGNATLTPFPQRLFPISVTAVLWSHASAKRT